MNLATEPLLNRKTLEEEENMCGPAHLLPSPNAVKNNPTLPHSPFPSTFSSARFYLENLRNVEITTKYRQLSLLVLFASFF